MDKLIAMVKEKTGITADQAKGAVETVLGFLKDRLPGPLGGQVEKLLEKDEEDESPIGKSIGGLFGK